MRSLFKSILTILVLISVTVIAEAKDKPFTWVKSNCEPITVKSSSGGYSYSDSSHCVGETTNPYIVEVNGAKYKFGDHNEGEKECQKMKKIYTNVTCEAK